MNVVVKSGAEVIADFECLEGSHVFVKNAEGEYFREWEELTPEEQLSFLAARNTLQESFRIATGKLRETLAGLN